MKRQPYNRFVKVTAILLIAVIAVSSVSFNSFADNNESTASDSETADEKKDSLYDNIIEFEEICELVKKGNPTYTAIYKSASETLDDMSASFYEFRTQMNDSIDAIDDTLTGLYASQKAIEGLSSEEVELMGVTMPKQTALSALSKGIEEAKAGRKQIKSALSATARSITKGYKSVDRALSPVLKQMTNVIEGLVISYKQLEVNRTMVEKQVALLETTLSTYKNMKKQGMSTETEVTAYENQLEDAKLSLTQIDSGMAQLKGTILIQLGFEPEKEIIIADIYGIDENYLSSRDVEMDREKTVTGNSSVREAGKVKIYSSTGFGLRDKEENEALGKAYAAFDSLLANVKKTGSLYETSKITLERAKLTRDMAKRQYKSGLTSKAAYEGQEMACISYEASAELARLNYLQSIRQYHYAISGLFTY